MLFFPVSNDSLGHYPQKDNEKDHKVRIAIGNGVRTDVWTEFLNRFGDIKVRELYAATEGNIGFINYTDKIGAVGRANFLHTVRAHKQVSNNPIYPAVKTVYLQ